MWLKTFALLVALMLPNTAFAQADNRYDPYGSPGDAGTDLKCSPGSYVVGLTGASGGNIDRIALVCAQIGADGAALPSTETTTTIGGPGGAPQSGSCSPGGFVHKVNVWLTKDKRQVAFVMVGCTRVGMNAVGFNFGAPFSTDGIFSPYPTRLFACPPNTAVTGLTLRHGVHVNAIGVFCGVVVRQPAPVAVTPPPPARTGRVVSPGAPLVKQASFTGTWRMSKRKGGTFTLVINPIEANELTGTFSSADGKFNGTLSGTVVPNGRNFSFTYRVTATGETGSGKMTYVGNEPKGLHFIGTVTTDGTPPVSDVWGGLRQ